MEVFEQMKDNTISKEFLIWLAGMIDGDGCFSIPICLRETKAGKKWINLACQVRVGLKSNDDWVVHKIRDTLDIGKVYYSNRNKEEGVCYWQTTRWADAIKVVELLLPHLILKKKKALMFLEACNLFNNNSKGRGGHNKLNGPSRDKDILLRVIEIATTINNDRQTKRYRNYKNYEYWEEVINELYN